MDKMESPTKFGGIVGKSRVWSIVAISCLLAAAVHIASASPEPVGDDASADQRLLVLELTADRAMAIAQQRHLADRDQSALFEQLQARDRDLRAAKGRAAGNTKELARVRRARDQIAKERQDLIAALAQRDQQMVAELRAYRDAITGIVNSPDPRKAKALQRFVDGDQRQALSDLDVIADAERAARDKAVNIADAAERRPIAWLAAQAHDTGATSIEDVTHRFEQLTKLDPGMTYDWVALAGLYKTQGRLADAKRAAQAAFEHVSGDPTERAAVLEVIGLLSSETGDLKEAKKRFDESLALRRQVATDNPTSPAAQRDLCVGLGHVSDVALASGDTRGARTSLEAGLAVLQGAPKYEGLDVDLGLLLHKLGVAIVEQGDLAAAKRSFEDSLAIRRRVVKRYPSSTHGQRDLAATLAWLGDVATRAGDLPTARARVAEVLTIARKLGLSDPRSIELQRDLSIALEKAAEIAISAGDLKTAKSQFEEQVRISRKMVTDNPGSTQSERDLAISLTNLGATVEQAGDFQEAKAMFEESHAIRKKIAASNQISVEAQRDVTITLQHLGVLSLKTGDLGGAKKDFEEGVAITRTIASADSTSAEAQRDLSIAIEQLGAVLVQSGDLVKGKASFEESVRIDRKLALSNPTSAQAQTDLAADLIKLGDVLVGVGDAKGGQADFAESLAILRKLAAENPQSADAQRELATSLERSGVMAFRTGAFDTAKGAFDEELAIFRKSATANPTSLQVQLDLELGLLKVGATLFAMGKQEEANARIEEALTIARSNVKRAPNSLEARHGLFAILATYGALTSDRKLLKEALSIGEELKRAGTLLDADRALMEGLQQALSSTN